MSGETESIAYCHACGHPMDVSAVGPFTNVECPHCGKHTRVKREFGPYTLMRRLAIGGMSVVFIAQDNTLHREVALKILNEDYSADEKRIQAFEEEARITAAISHPHVVRVFTTGRAFSRFYIAMELVSGGHLETQIRERGALPEKEMIKMAIQVAEGLRAAHSAGLIHRDVKPGNILLDASGNAKIVDFGLALVTKGGSATAEELWATPYYVPPETLLGGAEDFRADIYAFGASLYHALAGKPPCDHDTLATQILYEEKQRIPSLSQIAGWLHPQTCAVVDRAMAFQADDRFSSYEEMIYALQQAQVALQSGISLQQPTATSLRNERRAQQSRTILIGGIAGATLLASAIGVWAWKNRSEKAPSSNQTVSGLPVDQTGSDGEAALRFGTRYEAARKALDQRDYRRAEEELAGLRDDPAATEPTASWAAFQSVLAAYLDGRSADARKRAGEAQQHIKTKGFGEQPIGKALNDTLAHVQELPAIKARTQESEHQPYAQDLLRWFLYALKDWEQGSIEEATALFSQVAKAKLRDQDHWVAVYQKRAKDYLEDATVLQEQAPDKWPDTDNDCDKLDENWADLAKKLKTKGRAPFQVENWRDDLKKHKLSLGSQPAVAGESANSTPQLLDKIESLVKSGQFKEALTLAKELQTNKAEEKAKRDALVYFGTSSSEFLTTLEKELEGKDVTIEVKSADQTKTYSRITGSKAGGLMLVTAEGQAGFVPWREISTESTIELHRRATQNLPSGEERNRRHEWAIAYEWIAGVPDRADSAAKKLGVIDESYAKRWELNTQALRK